MIRATLRMPTNSAVALIVGGIASDNRAALAKIDKPTLIVVAMVRPWMSFYEDMQKRIRGVADGGLREMRVTRFSWMRRRASTSFLMDF